MLEEPDTDTEQAVRTMADADFKETLFGDTIRFMKEVALEKPDTDALLKKMDRDIFADFRKNFDSPSFEDFSVSTTVLRHG